MNHDTYKYWIGAIMEVGDLGVLTREQMNRIGPITEDPQSGFYRTVTKERVGRQSVATTKQWVAIWYDQEGVCRGAINGYDADPRDIWTYCCPYPVKEQTYRQAVVAMIKAREEDDE